VLTICIPAKTKSEIRSILRTAVNSSYSDTSVANYDENLNLPSRL